LTLFCGKTGDTIVQEATIFTLKEDHALEDWTKEPHVAIDVNNLTAEAFLSILVAWYTGMVQKMTHFLLYAIVNLTQSDCLL
jgi:hypothetical protein